MFSEYQFGVCPIRKFSIFHTNVVCINFMQQILLSIYKQCKILIKLIKPKHDFLVCIEDARKQQ